MRGWRAAGEKLSVFFAILYFLLIGKKNMHTFYQLGKKYAMGGGSQTEKYTPLSSIQFI